MPCCKSENKPGPPCFHLNERRLPRPRRDVLSLFILLLSGVHPYPTPSKRLPSNPCLTVPMCYTPRIGWHDLPCPASHGRPPSSPSNPSKVLPSQTVTFSPTDHPCKPFKYNTYGPPRKYCKQKTYGKPKSFKCNTYKKQGVAATPSALQDHPSPHVARPSLLRSLITSFPPCC